jgi:hypothetical protein
MTPRAPRCRCRARRPRRSLRAGACGARGRQAEHATRPSAAPRSAHRPTRREANQ